MFSIIKASQFVAFRLPSDQVKVEQILPNKNINFGKFGSFNTNTIIGRPFHVTYEILDRSEQSPGRQLRVVKAAELHAQTLLEEAELGLPIGSTPNLDLDDDGMVLNEKSNVAIFDDPTNQKLTTAEIEALKADENGSVKDLIARIMASHSSLDQKTAFSLAKYILRKQKKYMKRFTVLPLDVATLTDYMMYERDFTKVMEIRNETLGLICSWANVHVAPRRSNTQADSEPQTRYLVVDDTGGLVVAGLAERMGLLYNTNSTSQTKVSAAGDAENEDAEPNTNIAPTDHSAPLRKHKGIYHDSLATTNTLTLVHSNSQPNLSLLRYFNYDPNIMPSPAMSNHHPLHTHLKLLSWLQLVDPLADTGYIEPTYIPPEELRTLKSNARSTYHRKRRRWERCAAIVDETRAGGFNGLIVASHTDPISILHRLVPLLTGGAQIVVYSPHAEPLARLVDAYSTARRTAFLSRHPDERESLVGGPDFPVDPTLTLGFMIQTARVRKWQVLPGRTHPLMMGKGGAEGYIASATRVIPVKGRIEARGKQGRPRGKKNVDGSGTADSSAEAEIELEVEEKDEVVDSSDEVEMEENSRKRARNEADDEGESAASGAGAMEMEGERLA